MTNRRHLPQVDAGLLLRAYGQGWFPMAHRDGQIHWHDPDPRAIFPLDRIAPGRTMERVIRSGHLSCTVDRCFAEVMRACAQREETWITPELIQAYVELHRMGHAHSVETWYNGELAGGIYGVQVGGAFFGESMFTRSSNAGKVAFHHLAHHLRRRGFTLFDSQYANAFTEQLGVVEIPRSEFKRLLATASSLPVGF